MKTLGTHEILALTERHEKPLLEFLNRDRISHFFSLYDLEHFKTKTSVLLALSADDIVGYLLEYDKHIICMRGSRDCVSLLLRKSSLTEAMLNIEPPQLSAVKKMFEPIDPADKATVGKITTFVVMKAPRGTSKPALLREVRELKRENATELAGLLGVKLKQASDLLNGFAFGFYESEKLVSYAASPEILEDLAIVRGVFTAPDKRGKGYSKAVCSALVSRLLDAGKEVMLYVSKDNAAALSVYRSLGFMETGHRFLGFTARRRN
jgi:GNAT superfamily N-acetyltransferase